MNVTPVVVFIRRYISKIIVLATMDPPIGSKKRMRTKAFMFDSPVGKRKIAYVYLSTQAQARIIGMMECGASNGGFCLALKS
jgi:hypothetical protein